MPRRPPSRRVLCHVTTGRVPDIALIIEIFASQMLNGGVKFGLFNIDFTISHFSNGFSFRARTGTRNPSPLYASPCGVRVCPMHDS